ncbi:DUF309 domain-containing protein [Sulfurimonas microaerophilic]|uniref:DUF309 domain-containing protein n=1 Tax=Sulfurimonas microaerophilic TaxID=3058392 RepID=UPI0027153644|nr:DUF309 domain-containing protein [Sulfurimonas sp. hsl 1-7]
MINKKIEEFVHCIDESRFYDAHEALEEVWFPRRFEKCSEVELLKGFINAAVSFELIKRGRIPQSKRVWANYLKYRQNLYRINSEYKNSYHKLARYLENKQKTLLGHNIII